VFGRKRRANRRADGDSRRCNFALCAPDGKPRVVLQSRDEGGGISFVDGNGDLGAEVWGASEASWLSLLTMGDWPLFRSPPRRR
jgi:hypothetical protein